MKLVRCSARTKKKEEKERESEQHGGSSNHKKFQHTPYLKKNLLETSLVTLPKLVHCRSVTPFTNNELEQLQKESNKAFRAILNVPKYYTPNAFFERGKLIGSSCRKIRDDKVKILYARH